MGKNWAICIGINEYYNLQALRYAVQDAAAIRDFFLNDGKFEQVYYFADDAPPIPTPKGDMRSNPTFGNLKRFFRERFQRPFLEPGDNFWFFFAGHGELHEGHDYLMPMDVDPGNLEETALRLSDITAHLRNCGADNTVVLLDACRNRGRRQGVGLGTEEQQGIVTVYSCSPREASYEIEALGHGSFTYALLQGFALQAGNHRCATVEKLDQHLRYQVPRLNAQHGKPAQTPYTCVEPLSKNRLILLPQQATLEDVLALKTDAQEAELNNDLDLAERLWIRVLAASPADRLAITALQRIAIKRATQPPTAGSVTLTNTGTATPNLAPPSSPTSSRGATPPPPPPPPPQPTVPTFEFEVVTISRIEKTGLFGKGEPKVITQARRGRAEYHREHLGNGVYLDVVRIPSGTFRMGSPSGEGYDREQPQHEVYVPEFWMGKYPVTQAQWRVVAGFPKVDRDLDADPARFKGDNRPVETVSWDEAVEFCQRLSNHTGRDYRLPSEAEWEYACRAGTTTPFHFGETITTVLANYNGNYTYGDAPKGIYKQQTLDVGNFPANGFGLYDMHGNVWEWCADDWHKNYEGAPTDGSTWLSSGEIKLLRGGSWFDGPGLCRSAYRYRYARVNRNINVGFRVACISP